MKLSNDDSAFSSAPACHGLESFLFSPGTIFTNGVLTEVAN